MKVRSLVECINSSDCMIPSNLKAGLIYTVREIRELPSDIGLTILLDEIRLPYWDGCIEYGFRASRFRELLPPMTISIENILEKQEL